MHSYKHPEGEEKKSEDRVDLLTSPQDQTLEKGQTEFWGGALLSDGTTRIGGS